MFLTLIIIIILILLVIILNFTYLDTYANIENPNLPVIPSEIPQDKEVKEVKLFPNPNNVKLLQPEDNTIDKQDNTFEKIKDEIKQELKKEIKEELKECDNVSINSRFSQGEEVLKPFSTCGQQSNMNLDNPSDYFKKHFKYYRANLIDPVMLSYNQNKYDSVAELKNHGKIVLNDGTKYPQPNNYIF